MRIVSGHMVPLGYGSYVRSDRVSAVEPIEEGRGPGRRTRVWVDAVPDALIASRSDGAIVRDLTQPPTQDAGAAPLRQLLGDILETVDRLEPKALPEGSALRPEAHQNGSDRGRHRIKPLTG